MTVFPCHRIALDMGGGGIAMAEALHDRDKLKDGEEPIWEVIDYEKPKESDTYRGLHILYHVQFGRTEWVSEANHGMRKDFEDRRLLFPRFDPLTLELAAVSDLARIKKFEEENKGKTLTIYDSLEDCAWEIEELKNELTSIIMRRTLGVNGREKWLAPEIKLEGNVKITARKDRYSALLMANMVARSMKVEIIHKRASNVIGGLVKSFDKGGTMYEGPEWFTKSARGI